MEDKEEKNYIKILDGTKYTAWKFRIRSSLNEKDLLDEIDTQAPEQ